ncbi:MAG: ATP-binding protein [Sulfuricella sp.]
MSQGRADEKKLRAKLRTNAEEQLVRKGAAEVPNHSPEALLHELQVHQVELEMQNEELRRAYAALEESRDRYVDIYEFAPIGYLILTREGLISEINLTGAELLGEARKELIRRRFAQFVAMEDRDCWYRHLLQTLQRSDRQNCELSLQRDDGTVFHASLDCLRVGDDAAPVIRVALTDISTRKQAELALKEADRRKAEFLAMLAHELRNPLAPIRNAAYVIGMLGIDDPKLKWAQHLIENQVDYLTRMVDDLLDTSRITFNKISLIKQTLAFNGLVERVMESVRPLAEKKSQQLLVHLPEQPVQVEGDPIRLSQVLFNLLENASKYTPNGGKIEFDAVMAGSELKISVRDNGSGIPAPLLPRVFDLFQQGESTLDRPLGGMGIGLTLVKHLVEMHGGRVEVASPGQGQGSSFTVWLPAMAKTMPTLPPVGEAISASPPARGLRVLVVDDEPAVADSMAMLLDAAGYDVRTVPDGESALALVPQYLPRVVLLDIGLKGMDGFETAKHLRELPQGRDLYLLAITGYGDEQTQTKAIESGFDHLLVKPMKWSELSPLLTQAPQGTRSA